MAKSKANKVDEYSRDGSSTISAAPDVSDSKNDEELPHLAKFLGTIASVSSSLDGTPRESPMQQLMTRPLTGSGRNRQQGTSLVKPSSDADQQQLQDSSSPFSRDKESREAAGVFAENEAHAVPQSLGTVGLLRMPASLSATSSAQKLLPQPQPGLEKDRAPQLDKRLQADRDRDIKPNTMDIYDVICLIFVFEMMLV